MTTRIDPDDSRLQAWLKDVETQRAYVSMRPALLILAALSAKRGRVAPPTVYRALEFLLDQGLIHRIESLNAYVGCPVPAQDHSGQFLICRDCGAAAELSDPRIEAAIGAALSNLDFEAEKSVVEIKGLCPRCRDAA